MRLLNVKKIEEGTYSADSLPCPTCKNVLQITIAGPQLFLYNQGAFIQDVLPDMSADDRERFITGLCGPCWSQMFPED